MQVGILDPLQQSRQAVAGRQRRRIGTDLKGGNQRRPQQLGPGLGVESVGGGQELVDPAAGLADAFPQEPEGPQDPEQMRQRSTVVGQTPLHGGGQVARLGLQPLEPFAVADARSGRSARSASPR